MSHDEFLSLTSRYFDGELAADELAQLELALVSDPAKVSTFNSFRLQISLIHELGPSALAQVPLATASRRHLGDLGPAPARRRSQPSSRSIRLAWGTSLALASLVVASIISLLSLRPPSPSASLEELATLTRTVDAHFHGRDHALGTALHRGWHDLVAGKVQLRFHDGAEVILEGPTRFYLSSAGSMRLDYGRLNAMVPDGASGFTVQSPQLDVVDISTEFGVAVSPSGRTDVLVFSGEVHVYSPSAPSPGNPMPLFTGQGLRAHPDGRLEAIDSRDHAHRFAASLPLASPARHLDNLVANHSFEISPLSRSPYSEQLFRDEPAGWTSGRIVAGEFKPAREHVSGIVSPILPSADYPPAIHGDRYAWIHHGHLRQEVGLLVPGASYQLDVAVASQVGLGPGSDHPDVRDEGNRYRFGLFSEGQWLTHIEGQLEAGTPFQDLTLSFDCPPDHPAVGQPLFLILEARTRIFYDDIRLRVNP